MPDWVTMDDPGGTDHGRARTDAAFLDRLLQAGPYVTATATADGTFTSLRGPVFELFGYTADQIVGTNFLDHVDLESDPRQIESISYALEHEGLRLPMLFKVNTATGTTRMVEVIANSALQDEMIQGLAVFIRPFDERLLLDEVLESMAAGRRLSQTLMLAVEVLSSETLACQGVIAFKPGPDSFTAMVATAQIGAPRAPRAPVDPPPANLDVSDPSLPWNRARATGEEQLIPIGELPELWAKEVAHLDVAACWAVPVRAATTDRVEACIIVWRPMPEPPEPSHHVSMDRLVRLVSLAIDRDHQSAQLLYAARHDSLTALPNREQFFTRLERELGRARLDHTNLAVLYVDLDGFKPVNDRYGHLAGDAVLIETSRRIERAVRPGDLVARLGGDEFAVICPDIRPGSDAPIASAGPDRARPVRHPDADVSAIATRLIEALSIPITIGEAMVAVGASVGAAIARVDDEPDTVLDAADRALYAAKAEGKGRWVAADR